jgi:hypothetical protein
VTVCIAAIAEDRAIIAAADRMLSYGDVVQAEGDQSKVCAAAPLIRIMVAGPIDIQSEVLRNLDEMLLDQDDVASLTVHDMAYLYSDGYKQLHRVRAEQKILMPLNLTYETFIASQKHMAPSFIDGIKEQLQYFELPKTEAIITGIDRRGPQIYSAVNYEISHRNADGFATIGTGGWLAQSEFVFARHNAARPYYETISLVYSAKKRAEAAPYVGMKTDMFIIEEQGGGVGFICEETPEAHVHSLDGLYYKAQKDADQAAARAMRRMQAWLEKAKPTDPQSIS